MFVAGSFLQKRAVLGAAVMAAAFVFVWWIASDAFNLGVDEGIYFEGGRRIASGQAIYRDFFALTGPLTFWIQGLLASGFGIDISVLRLPMLVDVAFLAGVVYWLAARFESPRFAAGLSLVFLVFASRANHLIANHRWDSAAPAGAAIVAAMEASRRNRRWLWTVAGALAGAAAWATPSVAWVGLALAAWAGRRAILPLMAGAAAVLSSGAAYLASQHAILPMIAAMRWTAANYARANSVPYGSVNLGSGATGAVRLAYYAFNALPAVLPVLAIAGWGWRLWRRRDEVAAVAPLLGATAALVLSAWPRWSSAQLLYVAAVPFALCGVLLHRLLPAQWRKALYTAVVAMAAIGAVQKVTAAAGRIEFSTRAGVLRGSAEDAEYLAELERQIPPGESLFVFPYLPILYPLLDGHNPTRFLYLQPGMMTQDQEREAIAELKAAPPRWVVLAEISRETVLDAWPGSDQSRISMESMNEYLRNAYRIVDRVDGKWGPMSILERR